MGYAEAAKASWDEALETEGSGRTGFQDVCGATPCRDAKRPHTVNRMSTIR